MKNLTIKRSEWLRGTKKLGFEPSSCLLNSDGKRCCMGFDAHYVCGVPDENMLKAKMPRHIGLNHLRMGIKTLIPFAENPEAGIFNSMSLEEVLAEVNDRTLERMSCKWIEHVSDEEQEKILARLYSLVGYELNFVN